jgi:serine/threonine-protein kinase RsbW
MSNDSKDPVLMPAPEATELRLDADLGQLHIARAVAADFALRCDSDLDLIADMKVAVDELCINLMANAVATSPLICRFSSIDGHIVVRGQVMCAPDVSPQQDSFGWQVLNRLADELIAWTEVPPTRVDEHWLHIEFTTRRPDPS